MTYGYRALPGEVIPPEAGTIGVASVKYGNIDKEEIHRIVKENNGYVHEFTKVTFDCISFNASLSKILGQQIVNYDLLEGNGWQPDFEALEKMDLEDVKIMWTNYPNMPTGGRAMRETYEKLVDFAKRHDIVVVNDNPYSFILSDEHLSIMQVPGAKDCCVEFNSMSKSHNMPGWRVGMCISNPQIISWALKIKSNIDSGTFRGIQLAAAEALYEHIHHQTEPCQSFRSS